MSISRLKGSQIQEKVLKNAHIADGAAISETKLNIDWEARNQQALESKKVVDFVQISKLSAGNVSQVDLTALNVILANAPVATSAGTTEGVITDAPYNKVIVRNAVTGEPVLDAAGKEVFGRIEKAEEAFAVKFLTTDGLDAEVEFVTPVDATLDIQYMERFNLQTVSELFAANEKFVAGAADITAHQNIVQLAKDIYGSGYQLDRDGEGNLSVSLTAQIAAETVAREGAIVAEQTARGEAIASLKQELLSVEVGQGASIIGLEDALNVFTASNVEGALLELANRIQGVEESGGGDSTAVTQEVKNARGTADTLDARLDKALNEDGTLKAGAKIHAHYRARFIAVGGESEVLLTAFNKEGLPAYQVGNDSLDVYINGQLQEPGLNYNEVPEGNKIVFDIGDGTLLDLNDIITIKYSVNNAE